MDFKIPEKQIFKIGEVCEMLQLEPTVLRYWETEFEDLNPQKNPMGQRIYGQRDIEVAHHIKRLLYEEGYTIAGARKQLKRQLAEAGSPEWSRERMREGLQRLRQGLREILTLLGGKQESG